MSDVTTIEADVPERYADAVECLAEANGYRPAPAFFNNYTGLTVTNNTRPAGSTAVTGTYFGEYTATRDPRIIQLGVKLYF